MGVIAQCFGGKWVERKSYREVVMKLRCLAQFVEYLIRVKSFTVTEWLIFLGGTT